MSALSSRMAAAGGRRMVAAGGALLGRHPRHAGLAALVVGLAAATAPPWAPSLAAALVIAALAFAEHPKLGLALGALILVGSSIGSWRLDALESSWSARNPGSSIGGEAELLERPRPSRFGSSAAVRMLTGPARGDRLLARASRHDRWPAGGEPGLILGVRGLVRRPRRRAGNDFDYAAYLRRRGIAAELSLGGVAATGRRRGGWRGAVDVLRRRAERGLAAGLHKEQGALARGMVLGQDEAIPEPLRDDFRRSGLGHLLAVSGQNVMLLGALALPLLAAAGLGLQARLIVLLALIAVYVPLAGAGPSLQRASVMGAAGAVALAAGRASSRWYALLLAAAATVLVNPRVPGDPGWQLSFAAVGGIFLWREPLRRPLRGLPRPLAEGVAITVAATVATAPLIAHHFDAVPLGGLPANVLALPAVAPVMWIGMVQTALGQASGVGHLATALVAPLLELLGSLNGVLLDYLSALAGWFAQLPGGQLRLPLASPLAVAAAYGVIGATAVAVGRGAKGLEPVAASGAAEWRRLPRGARRAAVGALALAASLSLWQLAAAPERPSAPTVSFLDVGQGDATLIQHPDGAAVLFDGGPEEGRVVRLLKRAGVRRLSAVVATHASADHHGGLRDVLRQLPVDVLLDGGDGSGDPGFRALLAEADRRRVRRVPATAGRVLQAGGLTVRVLAPRPRPPGPAPEDPNPRAVVAVVTVGDFNLFLSADAESPSLLPLALPDVEAMKVPHHGSSDEGLPDLLRRLRPQVAAIEVGADNTYGHPAPDTLAALAAAVPRVHRTDRDGTIRLSVEGRRLRVETER